MVRQCGDMLDSPFVHLFCKVFRGVAGPIITENSSGLSYAENNDLFISATTFVVIDGNL